MLNNINLEEDNKNIKLIDRHNNNQTCDYFFWFDILQCLFGMCLHPW